MAEEAVLLHMILRQYGCLPFMRIWRQNTGVAKYGNRKVRFGIKGQGDLSGVVLPQGRRLEIEVKGPEGRQSKEQRSFQRMIESMGGIYILAYSLDDVEERIAPYRYAWKQHERSAIE